jgi:4-amino-4-deoxy-L-arabinose transferase-like glycosyltransferase
LPAITHPAQKRLLSRFLVTLLIAASALANAWFTSIRQTPFPGDEGNHLQSIMFYFHNGMGALRDSVYPPFFYFVSIIVHHVVGTSMQASIAVNILFLFALVLGTFGIARRITQSKAAATLAAMLVAAYPMTISLSRMAMLDFALMGMVALSAWLLMETQSFSRRGASLAFGVSCGLGMLTRGSFAIFLAGPVIVEIALAFRSKSHDESRNLKRAFQNFCLAAAIGLALAGVWYLPDFNRKISFGFSRVLLGANHAQIDFLSHKGVMFYPFTLIDAALSPWLFLPFAIGLPLFLKKSATWRAHLVSWIIFPWLVFSNMPWKLARYMAPALPAFAIITAVGLLSIKNKYIRYSSVLTSAVVAVSIWLAMTFGAPPPKIFVENGWASIVTGIHLDSSDYREDIHVGPPERKEPHLETIGGIIQGAVRRGKTLTVVRFLNTPTGWDQQAPYEHPLNFPLGYFIARENLDARLIDCWFEDGAVRTLWPGSDFTPDADMGKADFLLGYAGDLPRALGSEDIWESIYRFDDRGAAKELYRRR